MSSGKRKDRGSCSSNSSNVALSKACSNLLRHQAIKDKVPISAEGWVAVADLLKWTKAKRNLVCDEAMVRAVVEESDKQRFSLRETDDGPQIRANQGHSMTGISVEMRPLPESVSLAVHGTYKKAWPLIEASGLSRMRRQHVHLARDLPGQSGVVSGMRATCELLVWVNVARAREAGMAFVESENGVVLTDGFDGTVPTTFFDRVEDRATGAVIWPPDKKGAPSDVSDADAGASGATPSMQRSLQLSDAEFPSLKK